MVLRILHVYLSDAEMLISVRILIEGYSDRPVEVQADDC